MRTGLSNARADQHAGRFLANMQDRTSFLARDQQQMSSLSAMGSAPSLFDRLTAQQQRAASLTPGMGGMLSALGDMRDQGLSQSSSGGRPCPSSLSQIATNGRLTALGGNMLHNSSALARQRYVQSLAAGRSSFTANANNDRSFMLEAANLNGYPGLSTQMSGIVSLQEALLRRAFGEPVAPPLPFVQMSQPSHHVASRGPSLEERLRAHQAYMAAAGTLNVCLPVTLAIPEDSRKLSEQQVFLRHQIEAFQAGEDDISTHTRGRNKPIVLGQVGIRCKHCAHLSVVQKQKGSTYFPATLMGLYQAAQNMSTTHLQSGLCQSMPDEVKEKFATLSASRVGSSGAGRPYWANAARQLGLMDTEDGIRFVQNLPRS